jgi:hypothetical protein
MGENPKKLWRNPILWKCFAFWWLDQRRNGFFLCTWNHFSIELINPAYQPWYNIFLSEQKQHQPAYQPQKPSEEQDVCSFTKTQAAAHTLSLSLCVPSTIICFFSDVTVGLYLNHVVTYPVDPCVSVSWTYNVSSCTSLQIPSIQTSVPIYFLRLPFSLFW